MKKTEDELMLTDKSSKIHECWHITAPIIKVYLTFIQFATTRLAQSE